MAFDSPVFFYELELAYISDEMSLEITPDGR